MDIVPPDAPVFALAAHHPSHAQLCANAWYRRTVAVSRRSSMADKAPVAANAADDDIFTYKPPQFSTQQPLRVQIQTKRLLYCIANAAQQVCPCVCPPMARRLLLLGGR